MLSNPLQPNEYGRIWRPEWVRQYESLWGIIQRYKQINVLDDTAVMKDFGKSCSYRRTYYSYDFGIYIRGDLMKIDYKSVFLIPEDHFNYLKPIMSSCSFEDKTTSFLIPNHLVYCPICLEQYGFHSYLHQIAGQECCPWHPDQKLVTSDEIYYEVTTGSKYAFGSDQPDGSVAPLPMFTKEPQMIGYVQSPYDRMFAFFNSSPNKSLYLYLKDIKDDFKIISQSKKEMEAGSQNVRTEILNYLSQEIIGKKNLSQKDLIDWCNLNIPRFNGLNDHFLANLLIYEWVHNYLLAYRKEEVEQYIQLMSADSENLNPKILPKRTLVALLSCARAIKYVDSYFYVDSNYILFHPYSIVIIPYYKGINFNYATFITEKMFENSNVINVATNIEHGVLYIYYKVILDYLDTITMQIMENPYTTNLSHVREPNYLVAQIGKEKWGFYRL